jgi:hypothetical protein
MRLDAGDDLRGHHRSSILRWRYASRENGHDLAWAFRRREGHYGNILIARISCRPDDSQHCEQFEYLDPVQSEWMSALEVLDTCGVVILLLM